ncbi:mCG58991 [Mus musculus]|nr:mCG58991 [Mus musculus]
MQRHSHLVHLGCGGLHYTELYVGVAVLPNGLFSLTPVSPIVLMPLTFPHLELPELLEPPPPRSSQPVTASSLSLPPKLSCSAVPQACHSDHADQPSEATDRDWGQVSEHSGEKQYRGCGSFQSCLATWSHRPGPTYQPCLPSSGPIQGVCSLRGWACNTW